jgi:DNA-directed RNA polymerase specialized sigma24 family protein
MVISTSYCSPDEVVSNAKCLLGRVEEVRRVLRRRGFSEHCIENAVTAVFSAALPYITGTKICLIENRRAWVFKVAIMAAKRAAMREFRCQTLEPAILAATEKDSGKREEAFDIRDVMGQLTEQQSKAIEHCILGVRSHREAAKSMGIAVGTLYRHLIAGKKRLKNILAPQVAQTVFQ